VRLPERLQPADADGVFAGGVDHDELVAHRDRSAGERARDDGSGAGGGERTVDPEPRAPAIDGRRRVREEPIEREAQRTEPDTRRRVDGNDLRTGEERPGDVVEHVEARELRVLVVDDADLRQRDDAVVDAEQFEDAQVLFGLRLPSLGGRHDEQAGVDRPDARQHVLQEADVTGHVDEGDSLAGGQCRPCEAEVDRQTSALLLGEPIGVDAGERENQCRLAVIDVAGGGDDVHVSSARR
jgi:hypothetical protein